MTAAHSCRPSDSMRVVVIGRDESAYIYLTRLVEDRGAVVTLSLEWVMVYTAQRIVAENPDMTIVDSRSPNAAGLAAEIRIAGLRAELVTPHGKTWPEVLDNLIGPPTNGARA